MSLLRLAVAPLLLASAAAAAPFDVPLLRDIAIDGDTADWAEGGFQVQALPDKEGRMEPPADFQPAFRLGWDAQGLLVLVEVQDDVLVEAANAQALWDGDSVELFLAKPGKEDQFIQVVLAPGVSEGQANVRQNLHRFRIGPPKEGWTVESASRRTPEGYAVELRIPWSAIGVSPDLDSEFGFQIYANDVDDPPKRFQGIWYPETRTHEHIGRMHSIRLSDAASPAVRAVASASYDDTARVRVHAIGLDAFIGAQVEATLPEATHTAAMRESNGRAVSEFYLPMPTAGAVELSVQVGNEAPQTISLPEAAAAKGRLLISHDVRFEDYVFSGAEFPAVDFEHPLVVERLIGPYRIETVFYDKAFTPVTSADTPGRYGAVVTAIPDEGRPVKRFQTLFRQPESFDQFNPWFVYPDVNIGLPETLGIAPALVEENSESIGRYVNDLLVHALDSDPDAAVLFAGMHEMQATGNARGAADDAWALDRQWWVELKRALYPSERQIDVDFVAPLKTTEPPAPVLRDGTAEEAGMKPGAAEAIDAVLTAWSGESEEAFAVAVARNSVVFFQKAYGERNGEPMTMETPSWMASISKFISGTGMMILVDQGLVGLDDRVSEYLPALRYLDVKTPLTIRHLYTHTNGLRLDVQPPGHYLDHWGDEMHDLEEIVAQYYPQLEVGKEVGYNGVGYALGGKVIEMVTGEALPQFFKNHLLDPLGMKHTRIVDASAQTFSTPMDMAAFGQMMLNGGAYGEWRFFSEETLEEQMPKKLREVLGVDTDAEWGIGAVWMPRPGLSKKTYAHGAASSATLLIDPENQLVIVMTRNQAGENFGEQHAKFIKSIVEKL
jgi:CubicO group peptidase (beta-lactamase class C family)